MPPTPTSQAAPVELAAIERGAGPAVTLIHGGIFHSGPTWARQIGPLAAEGYRVLAVDRRGYGRSPDAPAPGGGRISVALQAADVWHTLELREASCSHLVGISYGALVALEAAIARPSACSSLTLVEPGLVSWLAEDPDYAPWLRRWRELEATGASGAPPEEWLGEFLSLIDPQMARDLAPGSPAYALVQRALPHEWQEESASTYDPDPGALAALGVPTLIVTGADSEPAPHAIAQLMAERIPGAAQAEIEGAGHALQAEQPDAFNRLLLGFLALQA